MKDEMNYIVKGQFLMQIKDNHQEISNGCYQKCRSENKSSFKINTSINPNPSKKQANKPENMDLVVQAGNCGKKATQYDVFI